MIDRARKIGDKPPSGILLLSFAHQNAYIEFSRSALQMITYQSAHANYS